SESLGRLAAAGDGEGRAAVLLFLTDGLPTVGETNPDAILAQARAAFPARARAFVFGVGSDVHTVLLDSLAASLRGARDYVPEGEDIERRVSSLVDKTRHPALTDLALAVEGVEISSLQPRALPDLFRGGEVVVAGRYAGSGPATLRVRARGRDGERVFERKVEFPERAEGAEFVDRLWAVRRVGFLLDEIRLRGRSAELVEEVVALGRRHGIVTPFTARLVLEPGMDVMEESANLGDPRFNADAPFEGAGSNADIGIGGGAGGVFGGRRGGHRNLRMEGGAGCTAASDPGIEWLKRSQNPGGTWGDAGGDPGTTGLALLPFLGYGETHRTPRYGKNVRTALKYLKEAQDAEGCFGPRTGQGWFRRHLQAALAMNEAYGLTRSPLFEGSARAGTGFVLAARSPDGGWGSGVRTGDSDPGTTAWAVMALWSARSGGLEVDPAVFGAARTWLEGAAAGGDPATSRAILFTRILCGADTADPAASAALTAALGSPPSLAEGAEAWWFGTLTAFRIGGDCWKRWNEAMKGSVLGVQRRDAGMAETGSWDPQGPSDADSRLRTTVYYTLCLEVYYRYAQVQAGKGKH
ncbi:MAG: hypothetical protein HUU06_11865, partial [Planctomycetaceae bacterium]|nr:hypothetical protein [Planctomycetaceae bacterium]